MDRRELSGKDLSKSNVGRKPYQTPQLREYGRVESLTQSGGNTTTDEDARHKFGG
jgi:hypothetical protein